MHTLHWQVTNIIAISNEIVTKTIQQKQKNSSELKFMYMLPAMISALNELNRNEVEEVWER